MDAKTLIDKAKAGVLTDEKLAAMLDVPRERISQWRKKTPCPLWAQIRLAEMAGMDPTPLALEKAAELEKNPEKRAMIRKALQLGAAGLGNLLATACAAIAAVVIGMTPAKASPTCDNV